MTVVIDGRTVADDIRGGLGDAVATLADAGVKPGLATVLMSEDPSSETYVSMKQRACTEIGLNGIHVEIDPGAPANSLYEKIDELNENPSVHGILVQLPIPDHVEKRIVLNRIDPFKDVDGFHPENIGRLVAGNPRYVPCTPHGVLKLIQTTETNTDGKDVTIVGRSSIVGKPLVNLLLQKADYGNSTVTVCHSHTKSLAEKTTGAEILIAAAGVPELIDGSMIKDGAVVIDVGVNRVDAETSKGYKLVGDVHFDSAKEKAAAITPVPGGVGPMTIAMLLYNTIKAASKIESIEITLP